MYVESEAMFGTMQQLMRDYQIPSFSVHDSLIVPVSDRQTAEWVLSHWYYRYANTWPILVAHFPDGREELHAIKDILAAQEHVTENDNQKTQNPATDPMFF